MKKRIISFLTLLFVTAQAAVINNVYAEPEREQGTAAPSSYTADDYIDYENNSNGIWKLYYEDFWKHNEYKVFTAEQRKNINFHCDFGYADYAFMAEDWVSPMNDGHTPAYASRAYMTTGYWNNMYTIAKGFTAPKTGLVRIYNPQPLQGLDYTGTDGLNYGASIRITHNSIKNAVLDYTEIAKGKKNCSTDEKNITTFDMGSVYLEVTEGDTIYFDVCDLNGKTNAWSGMIKWNPCVEYVEEYTLPESYRASDYFSTDTAENGPWACRYYTPADGYRNMNNLCGWVSGFGGDTVSQGNAWIQKSLDDGFAALSVSVGKYYMCPERNDAGRYDPKIATRAVRTFTVPYTGRISVTADDGNGESRILGSSKTKNGAYVRIMYNGRMVWPNTSNLNGERVPGGDGTNVGAINVAPLTLDVKKGDKLNFEVHTGRIDYDFWEMLTYWDPVVSYEQRSCYADNISVLNSDGKELTDFGAVAASGECTVNVCVNDAYRELGAVTLAAAVYDADGRLVSAGTDSAVLNAGDTNRFSMQLNNIHGAEGGCLKLFAFDSADNMKPHVRISGIDGVLMAADDSWMPTYENVSGDFYVPYSGDLRTADGTVTAVTAGEMLHFDSAETLHYTGICEDTLTVSAEASEQNGTVMFEANDFLHKIGVDVKRENQYLTGSFNGAEIKIPYSGDVAYYDDVNIELDGSITEDGERLYVPADYFDCLYGVTVNEGGASVTVYRPEKPVDYEKVLDGLSGGEEIIDGNNIYNINQSETDRYEMKAYDLTDGKFDRVLRMTTEKSPSVRSYDYRASAGKINHGYSYGDVLVMSFWARATHITDDTGAAYVGVTLEETSGWRKDFAEDVKVTSEWKKYYIPVTAGANVADNGAWLSFYCGFKPQTVEVAGFSLVNYKKTVELSQLKELSNSDTYKGREKDALWRQQAQKRIEKYRMNEFTVKVVDRKGKPVKGIRVTAKMTDSAFIFGTEQAGYDNEKISPYILNYFNGITASYAKLGMYNEENVKSVLDFAKENNLYSRGHALVYDHPIFMDGSSEECQKWDMYKGSGYTNREEAKQKFDDYIADRMERFPGFDQWDVLNEPDSVQWYRARFGNGFAADWFKTFNSLANGSKAYINSCTFSGFLSQDSSAQNFANLISDLKACGAPIDGGGIQCHLRGLIYPQTLYNQIDTVAKTVDEVTVTEFDIKTMTKENSVRQEDEGPLESDMVRDVLTAVYSHPKAVGFFAWGVCARNQDQGLLLDEDYNEKPTLKMWKELVMGEWRTNVSGVTDENGEFTFRGHLGEYDITVKDSNELTTHRTLTLDEKGYAEALRQGNSITRFQK